CLALSETRREHKASPDLRSGWMPVARSISSRRGRRENLSLTSPLIGRREHKASPDLRSGWMPVARSISSRRGRRENLSLTSPLIGLTEEERQKLGESGDDADEGHEFFVTRPSKPGSLPPPSWKQNNQKMMANQLLARSGHRLRRTSEWSQHSPRR